MPSADPAEDGVDGHTGRSGQGQQIAGQGMIPLPGIREGDDQDAGKSDANCQPANPRDLLTQNNIHGQRHKENFSINQNNR